MGLRVLALITLFQAASCYSESVQPIEIYTNDTLPPFTYRDTDGVLTGIYIETVRRAVSRIPSYRLSFNVVPWARAKYLAKKGKAFAILPPYFHAHDWLTASDPPKPYLWPYSLPLFTQKDIVACSSSTDIDTSLGYPDYLQDVVVAMWQGDGRAGESFEKLVKEKSINVVYQNSVKEVARVMLFGRANCTVTAKLPFEWYVNIIQNSDEYKIRQQNTRLVEIQTISENDGYLAFTDVNAEINFPFKKDFHQKFDIQIYKMKRSGEITEIVNQFVPAQ